MPEEICPAWSATRDQRERSAPMLQSSAVTSRPLRVFCLEDNPLIVFHLEQMLEELGHVFVGAVESFADLKDCWNVLEVDCALVDIDLADGRTGPEAVAWLAGQGVPALFVTGQDSVAAQHEAAVIGIVPKPIMPSVLAAALTRVGTGPQAFVSWRPPGDGC